MARVKGKTAIVTGATRGLGRVIAATLAREGANIVIWDIESSKAEAVIKSIETESNQKVVFSKVDVTDRVKVEGAFKDAVDEFGHIDILVNNAGVVSAAPTLLDLDDDQWDLEINVNLTGTYRCIKAVLKHMMDNRSGKIVNMASLAGELGRPITSAGYSSSKAGVLGLTMSVAQSVAKYGVNVNAICPGIILTEIHKAYEKEQLDRLHADIPFNRNGVKGQYGKPQDIADAVLFLASNESDYITGTRIRVNGGSLMG